jgi:hypothetical protein
VDLLTIEFRTLATEFFKEFAEKEKLAPGVTARLLKVAEEQSRPMAEAMTATVLKTGFPKNPKPKVRPNPDLQHCLWKKQAMFSAPSKGTGSNSSSPRGWAKGGAERIHRARLCPASHRLTLARWRVALNDHTDAGFDSVPGMKRYAPH